MDWDKIQDQWKQDALATDKDDLIGLLNLRFGTVPQEITGQIERITDANALERLVLVAANVPNWKTFIMELEGSESAFRIVGTQYQPFK
ncbi:hypothetical protein [Ferroacidibacillus organovorans]|uniref:Uncharacterized protein n=1 Tax=Ferroacidibacillus organovorans TaxID=1765683 RepID=A0A853KGI0_9BACL|nr:hypothetical protein [Ferroacidibacillus organovorans]KYP79446.1 hypothetical protein AYJ22_04010 [Ferroacidibacillus organovorans]OAG94500.1 hypothetical protein AYW79_04755 [Ferroacidibacillus organovorans]